MTITPTQAADALRDIARAEHRSRELEGYRRWAPILFLWGAICIFGYGAEAISLRYGIVWLPLVALGAVATVFFGRRVTRGQEVATLLSRRIGLTWGVMMLLSLATLALLRPSMSAQLTSFPGLVVGASYMLMGIWTSRRYAALGIAIFALTLVGLYALNWFRESGSPDWHEWYLPIWMACVMGGGLILGGAWLRKA